MVPCYETDVWVMSKAWRFGTEYGFETLENGDLATVSRPLSHSGMDMCLDATPEIPPDHYQCKCTPTKIAVL